MPDLRVVAAGVKRPRVTNRRQVPANSQGLCRAVQRLQRPLAEGTGTSRDACNWRKAGSILRTPDGRAAVGKVLTRTRALPAGETMKRLFPLMFLALSVAMLCAVRDAGPVRADGSKAGLIGPGVMEALAQVPTARVIVSLRRRRLHHRRGRHGDDIAAKQTAVAAAGARVVDAVPPAEFAVEHRYRAVAALTGHAPLRRAFRHWRRSRRDQHRVGP